MSVATAVSKPLRELWAVLERLLRWEQPFATAGVFSALQLLALTDYLVTLLPALMVFTATAHMQLLRNQRRKYGVMHTSSNTAIPTLSSSTSDSVHDHDPHQHQDVQEMSYCVDYEHRDGSLRTKLHNLNAFVRFLDQYLFAYCVDRVLLFNAMLIKSPFWWVEIHGNMLQVLRLDNIVETMLTTLLKLHSAYVAVDESISEAFIGYLFVGGCTLVVIGVALSCIPLYLILSVALMIMFGAYHPVIAPPVESVWIAHGAGAVQVQLTWMLAGAMLLPLLLVADVTDRALTSLAVSATLAAVAWCFRRRWSNTVLRSPSDSDSTAPVTSGSGNNSKSHGATAPIGALTGAKWAELVQYWDMLPAPAVRNTADGSRCGS